MPLTPAPLSLRGPLFVLAVAGSCALGCTPGEGTAPPPDGPNETATLAEVDLTLGGPEAGRVELLWVRDVAALSDGSLVVATGRPPSVRLYDAEGRFLQTVGNQGRTSDRYRTVTAVEALDGDRIAVRSGRDVLVYEPDGNHLESFHVPEAAPASGSLSDLVAGGEGSFVVPGRSPSRPPGLLGGADGGPVDHLIRVFVGDGRRITIPVPDARRSHPRLRTSRPEGWLEPFIVETLHAWSRLGHLVTGRNDVYSIRAGGDDSDPVLLERDLPRAPLAPGERELWDSLIARVRDPGAAVPSTSGEETALPDRKPHFRELFVDDGGRTWVWRYVEARLVDPPPAARGQQVRIDWREPTTFDVFAPDGRLLGTVVMPPLTRITQARGDTLWAVQRDADGHPHAVRLRLRRPLGDR